MKKKVLYIVLLVLCTVLMTACRCRHEWVEADCTTAKTCIRCDAVMGEPLGHKWNAATCTSAGTCSACRQQRAIATDSEICLILRA